MPDKAAKIVVTERQRPWVQFPLTAPSRLGTPAF